MGGGGGGTDGRPDIGALIEEAKKELSKSKEQGRRNVFISFAYEDIGEVNLLRGQAKNEKSNIDFNDWSVSDAFDSERAPYIKQKIGERIAQSSLTVVYLSENTNKSSWVKWEIEESIRMGKRVVGVFPGSTCPRLSAGLKKLGIKCIPWKKLGTYIDKLE